MDSCDSFLLPPEDVFQQMRIMYFHHGRRRSRNCPVILRRRTRAGPKSTSTYSAKGGRLLKVDVDAKYASPTQPLHMLWEQVTMLRRRRWHPVYSVYTGKSWLAPNLLKNINVFLYSSTVCKHCRHLHIVLECLGAQGGLKAGLPPFYHGYFYSSWYGGPRPHLATILTTQNTTCPSFLLTKPYQNLPLLNHHQGILGLLLLPIPTKIHPYPLPTK